MINILICGICGKMGATVKNLLSDDKAARVACGIDINSCESADPPVYRTFSEIKENVDVIVDFSSPAALHSELNWAVEKGVPAVLAATGYTKEDLKFIDECSEKVAIFKTANFSIGVNLLVKLVRETAETLGEKFDIEIVEKHHNQKVDAPSGTALMFAESANAAFDGRKDYLNGRCGKVGKRGDEIGIHAVRGGTIVGEHDVIFAGDDEVITISHSASSKRVFAAGAIKAAKWLAGKPAGKYDMTDII